MNEYKFSQKIRIGTKFKIFFNILNPCPNILDGHDDRNNSRLTHNFWPNKYLVEFVKPRHAKPREVLRDSLTVIENILSC